MEQLGYLIGGKKIGIVCRPDLTFKIGVIVGAARTVVSAIGKVLVRNFGAARIY